MKLVELQILLLGTLGVCGATEQLRFESTSVHLLLLVGHVRGDSLRTLLVKFVKNLICRAFFLFCFSLLALFDFLIGFLDNRRLVLGLEQGFVTHVAKMFEELFRIDLITLTGRALPSISRVYMRHILAADAHIAHSVLDF